MVEVTLNAAKVPSEEMSEKELRLLPALQLDYEKVSEHNARVHRLQAKRSDGIGGGMLLAEATVVQLQSGVCMLSDFFVVTNNKQSDRTGGQAKDMTGLIATALDGVCRYAERLAGHTSTCTSDELHVQKPMIFAYASSRCSSKVEQDEVVRHSHQCLFTAGFRQVLIESEEDEGILLVYKPETSPNYLDSALSICTKLERQVVQKFCQGFSELCNKIRKQGAHNGQGKNFEFRVKDGQGDVLVRTDLPWLLPGQTVSWPNRVIVVGGGIAGLAASATLAEADKHVVLLEASDRIGGRILQHTGWPGHPPLDMGGEFIEGENCNVLQLARQHGWPYEKVFMDSLEGQSSKARKCYVWANGQLLHLWDISSPTMFEAVHAWDEVLEPYGKKVFEQFEEANVKQATRKGSESDVCSGADATPLVDRSCSDLLQAAGVSETAYGILRGVIAQTDGARFDSCSAALEYQSQEEWSYGNMVFRLKGSNSVPLHHLLGICRQKQVDIRLNSVVTGIDYSGEDVFVTTSNGSSLTGSQAVVTVPLQVLKRNTIRFKPELSAEKRNAVEKIRMDAAIKVCCRFQRSFWKDDAGVIFTASGFLSQYWPWYSAQEMTTSAKPVESKFDQKPANCRDSSNIGHTIRDIVVSCNSCHGCSCASLEDIQDTRIKEGMSSGVAQVSATSAKGVRWVDRGDLGLSSVNQASDLSHECHVIVGFATAEIAEEAVTLEDDEIVRRMLVQLDEMHRETLSSLGLTSSRQIFDSALVCKWDKNRAFIHGGYSSPTVGCLGMRAILRSHVNEKLFFAGEATHDEVASIQIAWDTGVRAANEVLSLGKTSTKCCP